jgi:hypothetical protein
MTFWRRRGLPPTCLALGVAVRGLLVGYGSHVRAAVEAEKARAVEAEDQAFCARFGIGPETTRYSECAAALTDVRSRHDQRNADPFQLSVAVSGPPKPPAGAASAVST